MKRMNLTINGTFHGKSITVRPETYFVEGSAYIRAYLSKGQVRKIRQTLCGVNGCTCSDGAGFHAGVTMRLRVVDNHTITFDKA